MTALQEHLNCLGDGFLSVFSTADAVTLTPSPGNSVDLNVQQAMKLREMLDGFVRRATRKVRA